MKKHFNYDYILAESFSGNLTEKEKAALDEWIESSSENRQIYKNAEKVWKSLDLLQEMKRYDTVSALNNFHIKINKERDGYKAKKGILFYWQRVAAVLIIPLLLAGVLYIIFDRGNQKQSIVWQTLETPPGVKSKTLLPDGTTVWLNSKSNLQYPSSFSNNREVKLTGEAYFSVAKDKKHPFFVDVGNFKIKVIGTKFNVINYNSDIQTEVILAFGKVLLVGAGKGEKKIITEMVPGQQAIYLKNENKLSLRFVDTEKYISWIEGRLIFKEDPMDVVVNRLNRWFNVDIQIIDQEIKEYIYTATFQDETIEQILDMLKRTSPIKYTIIPGKRKEDGSFDKQKILLRKRN